MPNDITPHHQHDLEVFDPERYRPRQAAIDFGIEEARRIKNWPALEGAVDLKIAEQEKFIAWRKSQIRGVGKPWPSSNADRSVGIKLSSKEITDITGVSEKQAERMAAKLADRMQYREYLLGSEYVAAFLQECHVRGTFGKVRTNGSRRRNISSWRARCWVRSISIRRRTSKLNRLCRPHAITRANMMA